MGLIDLHTHSTASDGIHTPTELVQMALEVGLEVLSLTDHDTVAGHAELERATAGTPLSTVAGLELEAEHDGLDELHLLVYGAVYEEPRMAELLETMARGRRERGPRMLERLARSGVGLDWDEVCEVAGGEETGRAHFALVMVANGFAADCRDAVARYLYRGGPAYVKRLTWEAERCLATTAAAGGVGVLAHPCQLERRFRAQERREGRETEEAAVRAAARLEGLVLELVGCGLRGIEAHYPGQPAEQTRRYVELARRHGLIVTGGSDFHGEPVKPGLRLGLGLDGGRDFSVPSELAEGLRAEIEQARRARGAAAHG